MKYFLLYLLPGVYFLFFMFFIFKKFSTKKTTNWGDVRKLEDIFKGQTIAEISPINKYKVIQHPDFSKVPKLLHNLDKILLE